MKQFIFLLLFLNINFILFGQIYISGTVNKIDNSILPFVNIGIKSKNIGTLSDENGKFELTIPKQFSNDTLTFSYVGFEELNIPLKTFLPGQKNIFTLKEKINFLEEVIISNKKRKSIKIGTKTHNPFLSGSSESKDKNDIVEFAKFIEINNKNSSIQSLSIFLVGLNIDTATFRINFYDAKEGMPNKRIIEKSIIQRSDIKKGWLTIDLSIYDIVLKNDFFVGFEFLPERKITKYSFSYGAQFGGNSVARRSSLGKWEKQKGAALSAYVTLKQ